MNENILKLFSLKGKNCFKIIFQLTNPRTFRATSIGYLYEIAQRHKVVLLVEEIDFYTKKILGDRNLFPGLEKIIFFESPFCGDIFRKNYRLRQKSKRVVRSYHPDIVITPEDIWPMELYLLRAAKKAGAITVAIQDSFRIAEKKKLSLWSCLTNSHLKMPNFLPFSLRFFLVKIEKYLGHFLYYWILPLSAGEMPFPGKTSFVFWDTSPGLRDADYSAVFSKRDYDLSVKDGVSPEKLFVLGHPLERESTKMFFEKAYFSKNRARPGQTRQPGGSEAGKENPKILTIMWPAEKIGFKNRDYSLISEEETRENGVKIVKLISEKLADWKIFIKPHPVVKNISEIKNFLGQIPNNVSIVEPREPADKYIEMSSVVVGVSAPSTALFTASKQDPGKIILSLDLNQEFLGDVYKNFDGIEYIDSEKKLIDALDLIRTDKYYNERNARYIGRTARYKKHSVSSDFGFPDVNALIDHIYVRHPKAKQDIC